MRFPCMALAGLFVSTGLYAQTAPPATTPTGQPAPAAAAPDPARLDTLLHKWEDEMKKVQTLSAELSRSSVDKAYGKSDTYSGSAKYMKPNLAALEMVRKDDPQRYEKYVCTGTFLYEFVPASKVLRVHDLPSSKSGVSDDNFLSFLFGMKAEEAKKRYEMRLVKEDQWYVYIEVMPRFPADKADFQKARLILNHSNFLPRQVWFEQPNGNEITWDIPKLLSGPDAKVQRSDFDQPKQPAGWTTVRAPKTAAPSNDPAQPTNKVVRPQQPQP